jgi:esterase
VSVALAFDRLDGAHSDRAVAFLPGILGRGVNLRTIAKRFLEARPNFSALLVDLRGHGRSPKGTASPSIEAAARDIVDLAARSDLPLSAVVGHSFGGKVALEVARLAALDSLQHVITIDSAPGPRAPLRGGDSAFAVMDIVESLPPTFASKAEFVRAVTAAGQVGPLAEWLAGSLEKEDGHFRFALDLNEIRGLLLDFFARDLWPVVEHPPGNVRVHLLIAEHSQSYSPGDRERALGIAASDNRVTVDILSGGHWLHADNRDGVLSKLTLYLG